VRSAALLIAALLAACEQPPVEPPQVPSVDVSAEFNRAGDWSSYNRDLAGTRYSPLRQIDARNVADVREAWSYPLASDAESDAQAAGSEVTPLVVGGVMYLAALGRVVALQADSGAEIWRYTLEPNAPPVRRGLTYWPGKPDEPSRVFVMSGRRILALAAATGLPLESFGVDGAVELPVRYGSVPTRFENLLIIGSSTGKPSVRSLDVHTGEPVWVFDATPPADLVGEATTDTANAAFAAGAFTIDVDRGLLYAVFASAADDSGYGGDRPGDDLFGSSIVALDVRTGERRWHFQAVHHDLWSYDVAAPPTLLDVSIDGSRVPALALGGESGYAYLLNRVTGQPLFGIAETPMPQSDVPGEQSAATQPIPVKPLPIARVAYVADDLVSAQDTNEEHATFCRELRDKSGGLQSLGPFTPYRYRTATAEPRSTIVFPGLGGGAGWGGTAADPTLNLVFVNTTNLGGVGWIEPNAADPTAAQTGGGPRRAQWPYRRASAAGDALNQFAWNDAPGGVVWPCQKPPWGQLVAINVAGGDIAWQVPLGVTGELAEQRQRTGRPNAGGPIATAGGLVFVAATDDRRLRAFNSRSGAELWSTELPVAAHAVPITYLGRNGKQYVAIVAAGRAAGESAGATGRPALLTFALP
jgi:quinoprotein glucose dehydrogenase